jgi:hypothetical protein
MALGLFRVAFLVMLESTLTEFMKNVDAGGHPAPPGARQRAIKALARAAGLRRPAAGTRFDSVASRLVLALLLLARFAFWKPRLALRAPGHRHHVPRLPGDHRAAAGGQFVAAARAARLWVGSRARPTCSPSAPWAWSSRRCSIRIVERPHRHARSCSIAADKAVLWIMIGGFVIRIVIAPQLAPAGYLLLGRPGGGVLVRRLRDPRPGAYIPVPAAAAHRRQGTLIAARATSAACGRLTLITCRDTPDHESHDRFPLLLQWGFRLARRNRSPGREHAP